jgi:SOS-response transcriptional repressor LexA
MADLLGISSKYVGMLERGEKEAEAHSSLGLLFQVQEERAARGLPLGWSPDDAIKPTSEGDPDDGSGRLIPVIGWAHAGEAGSYEEIPKSWQNKIPTQCADAKAFAVSLEGDSMEPRFSEGDMLIVQPSEEAYSGCLIVARFVDDGVVFRRLEMSGGVLRLIPLNDRYPVTEHQPPEFSWIYPVWGRWTQLWKR